MNWISRDGGACMPYSGRYFFISTYILCAVVLMQMFRGDKNVEGYLSLEEKNIFLRQMD
jgi:hypothetical protein